MTYYTDLEQQHINDLCDITKEKHQGKCNIKDIDHIINTMTYSLHHDDRVNNVYGKKHITIGALKKLFVNNIDKNNNNKIAHEHNMIIDNHESVIDKKLNSIQYKKNRENNKCCKSCIIC
jgi:hypothetical protein